MPDVSLSAPGLTLEPGSEAAPDAELRGRESGANVSRPHRPWAILWGLGYLPGWGVEAAQRFVAERPQRGIASLSELARVAVRAGLSDAQVEILVRAGACDRRGEKERDRDEMLALLPALMAWARQEGESAGAPDLFSTGGEIEPPSEEVAYASGKLSPRERYVRREWERLHLGVEFTAAPEMDALQRALDGSGGLRERLLSTTQVGKESVGRSVLLVGLLCGISMLTPPEGSQANEPLATAQIEDIEGSIEVVAFPPSYARHRAIWTEGNAVIVTGRVAAHADGDVYLLCEHLAPLNAIEEEEEIQVTVKPSKAMKVAKEALGETVVVVDAPKEEPKPATNGTHSYNGNGNRNGNHHANVQQPVARGQQPAATGTARYRVVITLPNLEDDHEAIDAMIALKATLAEYPGEDIVTVRIPYLAGNQRFASVQLPKGVSFTHDLRDQLESTFSPQAVAVIELG
jgi:DNA polymerase III alpha subunit